ncbi:hypothetical protein SK128_000614 [Halocaridina rubra]|uniref:3-hydroxyisobutyrate dehydrogenase-like NAD-binding domain-containing protein n=1 Tax=Halocaridina rubra TaxID=373956 RepID=A0AAN9A087_HALRR
MRQAKPYSFTVLTILNETSLFTKESVRLKGGFGTALMAKDLGLAQDAATQTVSPTPLGSLAHQIYRVMCNTGLANKDFSSVFKLLQDQSKE